MKSKKLITIAMLTGLALLAALPAAAADIETLTVTAVVQDQVCLNGDTVQVTLSAIADSSSQPVGFAWDFTNNGSFDTRIMSSPTITHNYPDEVSRTARVGAGNTIGNRAQDTITFQTLRCGN